MPSLSFHLPNASHMPAACTPALPGPSWPTSRPPRARGCASSFFPPLPRAARVRLKRALLPLCSVEGRRAEPGRCWGGGGEGGGSGGNIIVVLSYHGMTKRVNFSKKRGWRYFLSHRLREGFTARTPEPLTPPFLPLPLFPRGANGCGTGAAHPPRAPPGTGAPSPLLCRVRARVPARRALCVCARVPAASRRPRARRERRRRCPLIPR